jgi:O-methyltransferase involved in polyketide biosynthesis
MPSQEWPFDARPSTKGTTSSLRGSTRDGSRPPSTPVISKVSTEGRPKEQVQLDGGEHMLMAMVHAKALDASGANGEPILNDPYAQQLLDRCELDFNEPEMAGDLRWSRYVCGRARRLDEWCQDFLARYADEPVTILHLGCGLDLRYWRVTQKQRRDSRASVTGGGHDARVRWMDIDRVMVVNLRQRLIDQPSGDYSLRTLSVGEPGWMSDLPADRRTLILAEGLFPYFTPEQAEATIREVVENFPSGELVFDVMGSFLARFSSHARPFRGTNISLKWGVDDVRQLVDLHPKLVLKDTAMATEWLGNESFGKNHPPWFGPITTVLASLSHSYRNNGQMVRLEF